MDSSETAFEIGADREPAELLSTLGHGFELRKGAPTVRKLTYYDTFDGRVVQSAEPSR